MTGWRDSGLRHGLALQSPNSVLFGDAPTATLASTWPALEHEAHDCRGRRGCCGCRQLLWSLYCCQCGSIVVVACLSVVCVVDMSSRGSKSLQCRGSMQLGVLHRLGREVFQWRLGLFCACQICCLFRVRSILWIKIIVVVIVIVVERRKHYRRRKPRNNLAGWGLRGPLRMNPVDGTRCDVTKQ